MTRTRTFLVTATALLAALFPLAAAGAPASAAPHPAPAAGPAPGAAVQHGGPLTVPAGEEGPVTTYATAALPGGAAGPVKASLRLPGLEWTPGGDRPGVLGHIRWWCAVNGGAFTACSVRGPAEGRGPSLDLPDTAAAPLLTYAIRVDADSWGLLARHETSGDLVVTDGAGAELARGGLDMAFVQGALEAPYRSVLHARDRSGVLWRYEATGRPGTPLKARTRIGGGWNGYTALAPLGRPTADGEGDLVARDRDGVLWYYAGSGDPAAPFWPRVRVGGGWNAYTSLVALPEGLLARDRTGVLWHYPRRPAAPPAAPFGPRARVGGGWNAYTAVTPWGTGLAARDTAGVLWLHPGTRGPDPAVPLRPRVRVGGGWNGYTALAPVSGPGHQAPPDLLARDRNGDLWAHHGTGGSVEPARQRIGWGWNQYDLVL
ncbi:hypothetical protein DEJ44_11570 [Streptomyces venezuelae]|uniref:hypothetical protein n=1 Tax=Streptomyces venezuelae TaxID=54571 RepID=UPI001239B135|nr:hypothetical protein [Streptomyces venezuelae]QES06201.1 hypothetical protein DEJ44_11570 [Streptomyces venezuelae]